MNTPGERLKQERQRLGLSQEAFARIGGVGKRTQINYESGERRPDAAYFEGIASAGANVDYILTGTPAAVRLRLSALEESTSATTRLALSKREGEFVRDVLYGVAIKNTSLVQETIENYVTERRARPAKKGAK